MDVTQKVKQRSRPDWLKIKLKTTGKFLDTQRLIKHNELNTVCEEAKRQSVLIFMNVGGDRQLLL